MPVLVGQLKNKGYNAKAIDLNIDFYIDHLTKDHLEESISELEKIFYSLQNCDIKDSDIIKRYNHIKLVLEKTPHLKKIPNLISRAIEIYKTPDLFYNPKLLIPAKRIIETSNEIFFLRYNINVLSEQTFGYKHLKEIIFDTKQNIFINFFRKKIKELNMQDYDYIGISSAGHSQVIAALTLSSLLKQETKAHISLGGNTFSDFSEDIQKHPEFFDIFADSVSYGRGEKSIIQLAEYINNKRSIHEISNLIYKENGEIIKNPENCDPSFSDVYLPDFDDYNFKKYIFPEILLPIQTSKGCYHNKCTFCNFSYNTKYQIKNLRILIEEIKRDITKYNIKYFFIVDDSIHPKFLDKFADEIIRNKLDIRFDIFARLEKEFTYDILSKAYKAGLRRVRWGLESINKRVNKAMNKCIDVDCVETILKNANEAGIYNTVNIIYGFPTATYEEDMDTLNFIKENYKKNIIHYTNVSPFSVRRGSYISLNPEKYNLEIEAQQNDFSSFQKFKYKDNNETATKMKQEYSIFEKDYQKKYFKLYLTSTESFLYASKYGTDKLNEILT